MGEVSRYIKPNSKTIRKLAKCGLFTICVDHSLRTWEIKKKDLDSEPRRSIFNYLRETGNLIGKGVCSKKQMKLF
jgi:hypothetical protein